MAELEPPEEVELAPKGKQRMNIFLIENGSLFTAVAIVSSISII